ncbi:hypothetical protein Q3G72_014791 [Acer saccharum]|nr:hypothetical protein Q3G72_014791 [Acer saccharum]
MILRLGPMSGERFGEQWHYWNTSRHRSHLGLVPRARYVQRKGIEGSLFFTVGTTTIEAFNVVVKTSIL